MNDDSRKWRMMIWGFACSLAACSLSLSAQSSQQAAAPRPNIVVILADDLGYSDLGCYGSEIATPNLDELAGKGLRLTQFYTTPRCCPTRASLLTGLYPQQAGIGNMMEDRGLPGYRGELNRDCPTIAEVLREAGYRTSMVGKWHVCHIYFDGKKQLNFESDAPFWKEQDGWPLQRGFEEYYGTVHGVCSYYDPFSLVSGNAPTRPANTNFYYTDAIGEHAAEQIAKHSKDGKPFFLYVAFTAPHWPLQAPEADIARYRERYLQGWDAIRTDRYRRQIEMGLVHKDWPLSPRDPRVHPWDEVKDKAWEANRMATYAAMVEHLDRGVGRIVAQLRKSQIEQNTLVIFFSDNGGCAEVVEPSWYDVPSRTRDGRTVKVGNGDHSVFAGPDTVWQSYGVPWANVSDTPFLLYKHFTHEGGIAVPFIVSWPAKIKNGGATTSAATHVTDIMPTLLEVAGTKQPATFNGHMAPSMEGESMIPVFLGDSRHTRAKPICWEHEGNRAVRLGIWKLVARHRQNWELYDAEKDRTESTNLASRNPEKVKELEAIYNAWATRCNVVPPDQLPPEMH
jgi:arylsulfatase